MMTLASVLLVAAWRALQEPKASLTGADKDISSSSSSSVRTASSSWGGSITSMLEEFVEPSTLALCGVVLGACASALLVLGANAWLKSRQ
jgi:hypothetical protein